MLDQILTLFIKIDKRSYAIILIILFLYIFLLISCIPCTTLILDNKSDHKINITIILFDNNPEYRLKRPFGEVDAKKRIKRCVVREKNYNALEHFGKTILIISKEGREVSRKSYSLYDLEERKFIIIYDGELH